MKVHTKTMLLIMLAAFPMLATSDEPTKSSTSPEDARAYIIAPANGEIVGTHVAVKFGLQGMGVSPAGHDKPSTGHHHLLINGKKLPDTNKAMGAEVIHFGGGQTETTLTLTPGKHTLQLILGNHLHIPHNPPIISEKITIYVKEAKH